MPSTPSDEYIRNQAKIYGRDPNKKITPYQEQVNAVALQLALENPDNLLTRQKLIELAREKVNEVYNFKKGKSRSKKSESSATAPKRIKTSEAVRTRHISRLEEDLKDLS